MTGQSSYVLNPSLHVSAAMKLRKKGEAPVSIDLLSLRSPGQVIEVLRQILSSQEAEAEIQRLPEPLQKALAEMGVLVPKGQEPKPVMYDSSLNPALLEVVPESALEK